MDFGDSLAADLPLLVRMDTLKKLQARDVIPDYQPAPLSNFTRVLGQGQSGVAW